jgi:hypothetical protein
MTNLPSTGQNGKPAPPVDDLGGNGGCRSLLRADLVRIGERFAAAQRRQARAATAADQEAAEAERDAIAGEFFAAATALANLCLLLLRYASEYRPEALRVYLVAALRPEFDEIARLLAGGGKK